MREILFRGKSIYRNEWVEGNLLIFPNTGRTKILKWNNADLDFDQIEVDPKTVGQSTDMWDKNRKTIFEGDIIKIGISQRLMYVRWNGESLAWEVTDVGVSEWEVNHLYNTFDLAEIQVEAAYGEMFSEVIGNIHDNPELWNN